MINEAKDEKESFYFDNYCAINISSFSLDSH